MSRWRKNSLVILLAILLSFFSSSVQASKGLPGSTEFGYGAFIFPGAPGASEAVRTAENLGLDWVCLPVNWARLQPVQNAPARLDDLDLVIHQAEARGIAVMISLYNPPGWALTSQGPDRQASVQFVSEIAQRYASGLKAIELFPGANTSQAWKAQPSPAAYARLFRAVQAQLRQEHKDVLLVAGGLRPLPALLRDEGIRDADFLQGLYDLGAADWMPVISLQFPDLTGNPLLLPSSHEERVLRHYEDIRQVMVKNHHQTGLIWITQISLPSGKINIQDSEYHSVEAQVYWLSTAYQLIQSQLYIGVAIIPGLNSEGEEAAFRVPSLVKDDGGDHLVYSLLQELIGSNGDGTLSAKPGRPKDGNFLKQPQ